MIRLLFLGSQVMVATTLLSSSPTNAEVDGENLKPQRAMIASPAEPVHVMKTAVDQRN